MRNSARLPLVLAALALLTCAGCIRLGVDVAVAPDQSSSARLLVGLDSSLGEAGGTENPFADLAASPVGKNWTFRSYKDGTWQMNEAVGKAAAGQPLFPEEGDSPKLRVRTSARRLSTRYDLTLVAPPPSADMPQPQAAPAAPAAGEQQPGMPDISGLAQSLMGSMDIRFSLRGPGRVIATTGQPAGPGKAEWKLDLAQMGDKKTPMDFRLTTELPNWLILGRLADQIVMRGGPADAGSQLAAALDRGLLPNPPLSAAAADKLTAADYQRLLEIIARLDAAASPALTDTIIKQARLNDEDVTSARLEAAHARLMKADVTALTQQATVKALAEVLGQ